MLYVIIEQGSLNIPSASERRLQQQRVPAMLTARGARPPVLRTCRLADLTTRARSAGACGSSATSPQNTSRAERRLRWGRLRIWKHLSCRRQKKAVLCFAVAFWIIV